MSDPFINVRKISPSQFSQNGELLSAQQSSRGITYVVFYSSRCPHCHHYAPTFTRFSKLHPEVTTFAINVAENNLSNINFPFSVSGVPMTAIYINSTPVGYLSGNKPMDRLEFSLMDTKKKL